MKITCFILSVEPFSKHLSPSYHSVSSHTFSAFHKLNLYTLTSNSVSCSPVIISEVAFAKYQVRQMHIHRQPDAFHYFCLQRRPELCMSLFGNLFLSTELCVFLHHNFFFLFFLLFKDEKLNF